MNRRNIFGLWWAEIDRVILIALVMIFLVSGMMVASTGPAIAERIGADSTYFIKKQLIFFVISVFIIGSFSSMNQKQIISISSLGLLAMIIFMIIVLFVGVEVKGAKRWITIAGFTLQPSEVAKPFFIILTSYILAIKDKKHYNYYVSIGLYLIMICLLILQPDLGMSVVYSAVWAGILFLSGISLYWIFGFILSGALGLIVAYYALPHVTQRINNFLDPSGTENYQITKSIAAFVSGGIFGRGPGEGVVKQTLPDAHTDFIFAVIGEEFGMIACIVVVLLFATIVIRGLLRSINLHDLFTMYATSGLIILFGVQSVINMGVTLHLLPTKGMTLPFVSYGGSSLISMSIAVGIILALTKHKYNMREVIKSMRRIQ